MRFIKAFLKKSIRVILKGLFGQAENTFVYYPVFTDMGELAHHYYAAKYFLPLERGCRVVFLVSNSLKDAVGNTGKISLPDYFDDELGYGSHNPELHFCGSDIGVLELRKFKPSTVLVWTSVPKLKQKPWALLLNQAVVLANVDRYSAWDCYNYPSFRFQFVEKDRTVRDRETARKRFVDYVESLTPLSKAYVFGTGPSVETAYNYNFSDGFRIICNTLVKNDLLMEHIKPNFIVAADGIYHFGISKYAASFRRDLERTMKKHNCILLMPESYYANFIFHYPHLKESTIPVPYTETAINLDMKSDLSIKPVHNVLNQLLLPLGSSLANEVRFLGFDGRKPNDEQFWSSSNAVNYEDLKVFQQKAHPGFFKEMDYEKYAKEQGELAEEIISYGESLGKRYYSLNESTNSALAKRLLKTQGD